jgi:hypothetical protein
MRGQPQSEKQIPLSVPRPHDTRENKSRGTTLGMTGS